MTISTRPARWTKLGPLGRRRTALAIRCRRNPGDQAAWAELFELMNGRITIIGRRYRSLLGTGGDGSDLRQAGRMGVMRAVRGFDRRRGYSFETFAVSHIRAEIQNCAADMGARITTPKVLRRAVWGGYAEGERPHFSAASVAAAKAVDGASFWDAQPHDLAVEDTPEPEPIPWDAARLTDQEAEVIRRRFGFDGEPETLGAIGASMWVTRQRVRQIEAGALARLATAYARGA